MHKKTTFDQDKKQKWGTHMPEILHQQRLLLELLIKSGDIGVPDVDDGTLLFRTLQECIDHGWITMGHFGAGVDIVKITDAGRAAVKDRRGSGHGFPGTDRRRINVGEVKRQSA
ncbi:hypothetical protein V5T82_08175 [Magnetovibrio sp. PR-2]|uniref:hypothetical protein n=1 Tax=Magnetovibrio sp. PR-2 TaxID=3120356 RepID=UPI002FCE668D